MKFDVPRDNSKVGFFNWEVVENDYIPEDYKSYTLSTKVKSFVKPQEFRTQMCEFNGQEPCPQKLCWFAHSEGDLR